MLQLLQVPLEVHFHEHCRGFIEIVYCADAGEFSMQTIEL
jgi:hypothetical protein